MNEQHDETTPTPDGMAQPTGEESPLPTWAAGPTGEGSPEHDRTTQLPDQGSRQASQASPGPQTPQAPREPQRDPRPGPRTGPIVWGALILAFCGYIVQRVFGSAELDTGWWIAATTIALGALLLVVGVAVVVRGRRRDRG